MTILIAAMALATAPVPTAVQPAAVATRPIQAQSAQHSQHSQPAQPGAKPHADGCCCMKKAGGAKMACCAEHGDGRDGAHSEHSASR
jgi:hypothetical protein